MIVVGLLLLGIGIMVLIREHGSRLGRWYCAFSASVGLYCLAAGISYAVIDPRLALAWERVAHMGVALIPSTFFMVTLLIVGDGKKRTAATRTIFAISLALVVLAPFSPLVIPGNVLLPLGHYPRYGAGGFLLVLYFAAVMLWCYPLYVRRYRSSVSRLHKDRLHGMMLALGIGYLGAVDFLPALGLPVYAFGFVPIFLFVLASGYVILRYRLVDITPEVAAEQILQTMWSAVLVADREGVVRVSNEVAKRYFSLDGAVLEGRRLDGLLPGLAEAGDDRTFADREIAVRKGDAEALYVSLSSSRLEDRRGLRLGTVYVAHDISDRKSSEERLERIALHDALTGLPNRVLLFDRLSQMMARSKREGVKLALLYMDLDRFKAVNDLHGHAAGDELLTEVAARLGSCVRGTDTIARVGGDEFIGLCGGLDSREAALHIAGKVTVAIEAPFLLAGLGIEVGIGVSVGIGLYPDDGEDPDSLLSLADRDMYRVKEAGRRGQRRGHPPLTPPG